MLLFFMSIVFLLSSFACENPFTTRTPELPEENNSTFFTPNSPEDVFLNLQISIAERNVENYIRSFVDSSRSAKRFLFVPDPAVATTQPGTFLNWSLSDERRYLFQLFQATPADSLHSLRFVESETPVILQDTATFTQDYTLTFHHTRQNESVPVVYRGQARFQLERNETGDWAIDKWEDFGNGTDPSWSDLKAFFQ